MSLKASIIDLFAGPGGLGEGFSSYSPKPGQRPFHIKLSVEKEVSAHRTLELRAFYRQFSNDAPNEYYDYLKGRISREDLFSGFPKEGAAAIEETLGGPRALGDRSDDKFIKSRLEKIKSTTGPRVLIGGPPCQAYSLVGRARNKGNSSYVAEDDHRHFLYKEYLNVLHAMQPEVFVMENVKGILSSKINGERIFPTLLEDLSNPAKSLGKRLGKGYQIHSLVAGGSTGFFGGADSNYTIRSENYGIPQARHRVILLGVRNDIGVTPGKLSPRECNQTASSVLADLPSLRSGLSKGGDSSEAWHRAIADAAHKVALSSSMLGLDKSILPSIVDKAARLHSRGGGFLSKRRKFQGDEELSKWYLDSRLDGFLNHESRGHINDDLARYLFCSIYAMQNEGASPRANDFPEALAPNHANWKSGNFVDRFKVQANNRPSSTVTSHISKDGHYFIHPDPSQCRSLTVREAARLQTFPDNYYFEGNRTQQYVQVGNAVPPLLASQIAEIVYRVLQ